MVTGNETRNFSKLPSKVTKLRRNANYCALFSSVQMQPLVRGKDISSPAFLQAPLRPMAGQVLALEGPRAPPHPAGPLPGEGQGFIVCQNVPGGTYNPGAGYCDPETDACDACLISEGMCSSQIHPLVYSSSHRPWIAGGPRLESFWGLQTTGPEFDRVTVENGPNSPGEVPTPYGANAGAGRREPNWVVSFAPPAFWSHLLLAGCQVCHCAPQTPMLAWTGQRTTYFSSVTPIRHPDPGSGPRMQCREAGSPRLGACAL